MSKTNDRPPRRSRLRVLYHMLFVLLIVHTVLVYAVADYLTVARAGWSWLFEGAPGGFIGAPPRVLERGGKRLLWAGSDEADRFDITDFQLDPNRLKHGLGREYFDALIDPQFETVAEADEIIDDDAGAVVVRLGDDVRIYPLPTMRRHEIVNDVIDDRPFAIAYCKLAGLAAAYERTIDGRVLTYALSGYTYVHPDIWDNNEAFVLWDRETESLWWPPIGQAVSGVMNGTPMRLMDQTLWAQATWGELKQSHPNALVLKSYRPESQADGPAVDLQLGAIVFSPDLNPPDRNWPAPVPLDDPRAIAPRWGKNTELSEAPVDQ